MASHIRRGLGALLLVPLLLAAAPAPRAVETAPRFAQPLRAVDLDGDGRADRVELVRVARGVQGAAVAGAPSVANPWDRDAQAQPLPLSPVALALRITNSASGHVWLLHGAYLESILDMDAAPVTPLRRTTREWRAFRHDCPELRHDVLQMPTQAGIDIALYWSAGRYRVCWPNEVP